ncbi:MAG: YceI family protein [Myxococcota bacterium]
MRAEIEVYTYKEGVLSRVAHDLRIRVQDVSVGGSAEALTVRVQLGGLQVMCAQKDGVDDPRALSDKDKRKIENTMRKEVLHVANHPHALFEGRAVREGDHAAIEGTLSLHGRQRPLRLSLQRRGDAFEGEFMVHQPDYGITPYTAMLGALKVKADVRVRVRAFEG